jgi:hypothetical protein
MAHKLISFNKWWCRDLKAEFRAGWWCALPLLAWTLWRGSLQGA